ncbi:MAG: murein biosynthesis integral membrane protein MurJ [bacterium]|nr:murein biosynthesis integral membrane protein MurJ [bacterium]
MRDKPKSQIPGLSIQTWVNASSILLFCTVVSKLLGFVREILVAKNFGAGTDVDAYMIAITIPTLIGGSIGSAFGISLVPFYQRLLNKEEISEANKHIRTIVCFTIIISIFFLFFLCFMSEPIIKMIAPGLPETTFKITTKMTQHLSIMVLGLSLFHLLTAIYNAFHHFKIPAFADLTSILCVILMLIFFSSVLGIYALVFGLIIGTFLAIAIQIIYLFKKRVLGFKIDFRGSVLKEFIMFTMLILCYDFFSQTSGIIENFFASGLTVGSISALGYAKRLFNVPTSLVSLSVVKAIFPTFSTQVSEQKLNETRSLIVKLIRQIIIFFLPLSIILIFFSKEFIRFIFMRGAFDDLALQTTSNAFIFYIVGLTASVIIPIFIRLCYAFSDTITPLRVMIISLLFMIFSNYLLVPLMGIKGIALTSTLGIIFTLFAMGLALRKKLGGLQIKILSRTFGISLLCALISLLPILPFRDSTIFSFVFSVLLYFMFYFVLGWFLMKDDIPIVWKLFKRNFYHRI